MSQAGKWNNHHRRSGPAGSLEFCPDSTELGNLTLWFKRDSIFLIVQSESQLYRYSISGEPCSQNYGRFLWWWLCFLMQDKAHQRWGWSACSLRIRWQRAWAESPFCQERRSILSSSGKGARGLADVPGVNPGKSAQSFGEGGKPSWHLPALEQGWARVLCPKKRKEASWANPPLPSSVHVILQSWAHPAFLVSSSPNASCWAQSWRGFLRSSFSVHTAFPHPDSILLAYFFQKMYVTCYLLLGSTANCVSLKAHDGSLLNHGLRVSSFRGRERAGF